MDVAAAVGCMPGHQPRPAPAWITADVGATLLDIMVTMLLGRSNDARARWQCLKCMHPLEP